MPIYNYECSGCGYKCEVFQDGTELQICPKCQEVMGRKISLPGKPVIK